MSGVKKNNLFGPTKRLKMAQGQSDVKPKLEAEFKVKIEPVEEFNRNMEIITNMSVPAKTIEVPYKKPKIEMDVKPKIETNFRVKSEPVDDINRGMEIITKLNVSANGDIKNENIDISYKKENIEKDVKLKVETDIKIKTESIEEFNRSIEIITKMNVPTNVEIKNDKIEPKMEMDVKPKIKTDFKAKIEPIEEDERIEVPYKKPKIEMDVKPKIETDFLAKSEPIDDVNRGMKLIGNMDIPIKAKIQTKNIENYKCSVCNLVEFSDKNLLMQHMSTSHTIHIENVFEKAHKSCGGPFRSETKSLSKLSILDKVFHMIYCNRNKGNDVHASEDIVKYHCIFCIKKGIPTEKDLERHLMFYHMKDITEMTKCYNCNIPFFGTFLNLKISHFIECYSFVETKISNQRKPDVKAKINCEKHDCFICSQKNFPSNESLIQHLSSVHMRNIKRMEKCGNCMIRFCGSKNIKGMANRYSLPIPERISHLINCYQKKENKTKVECNSSIKKPVDIFKYVCIFCPKMTFLSQQVIFTHITLKCEGPRHGSENQDCRKIYDCILCGVVKNVTLHRLMQHMVEFHQEELELKQQCSNCFEGFEFYGKTSVYEKIKHIVFAHLCQCSVCRICKGNRTASIKGGPCLNSQI